MPLKNIPDILSPDLLHVLALMGHGDELVLADAHFPTSSICRSGPREVRADGLKIPELLEGVLQLLTLDQYVDKPVGRMDLVSSDKEKKLPTPVWDKYIAVINKAEGKEVGIELIERFAFYERAKKAFAIVHTGETAQYGNIILKKDSHKAPERRRVGNTEQTTWRKPKQDLSDEVIHLKLTGVGKTKRKTRRGKRGGVRRKMQKLQREHKMLEAVVGEWVKDIRHRMEAPQSDHVPSRDVTVDVLASDVDEMSITPSHVDPLFDYEYYFPQEINHVIDNRVDVRSNTGSSQTLQDVFSYYGNNSIIAPAYGQMEMDSGCATINGQEVTGCGYGNEVTGCGYGNGQECGCGNRYSDGNSIYRYYD